MSKNEKPPRRVGKGKKRKYNPEYSHAYYERKKEKLAEIGGGSILDTKRRNGEAAPNDPAEVVHTHELAVLVKDWIARWDAAHPATKAQPPPPITEIGVSMHVDRITQISGRKKLMMESGVSERQMYSVMHEETQYTSLWIADKLLTAMHENFRIMSINGKPPELTIVANPRWSQEQWQAYMEQRGCY